MTQYTLNDLQTLMSRLRDPRIGCPWDIKQTFASIMPHTLEEAYEVADAIEREDWPHLEEELGDLFFQIVFYVQMAQERELFSFDSIVHKLTAKLIRRHPHVFPDGTLHSQRDGNEPLCDEDIAETWQQIKQQEQQQKPPHTTPHVLDAVACALPELQRAYKLQKAASSVGFDWPDISGAMDKLHEELNELQAELPTGANNAHRHIDNSADNNADIQAHTDTLEERIHHELGDVLFSVVNIARHLNIKPEHALRDANRRFQTRFEHVEQYAHEQGGWSQCDLDALESAWQLAKKSSK